MIIIEVKKNNFVNIENLFRMDILHSEDNNKVYWRFYANDESFCSSKEFSDVQEANIWLSMQIARAQGSNEIISL
ncbi:MAG: hypothetical protein P9M11_06910 [Candidatus Tenebribacter burtonii]|jgi:hypothetical protein|nr:hypothetical protein [Candidatus Tenebribacter burtonii]